MTSQMAQCVAREGLAQKMHVLRPCWASVVLVGARSGALRVPRSQKEVQPWLASASDSQRLGVNSRFAMSASAAAIATPAMAARQV